MLVGKKILSGTKMPFCPGCGHGPSTKSISKALEELRFSPLNVILVSDIGCCGLIDPLFETHTVHGLHGRSPALGLGISLGLSDPSKKVIVIQGDGGATIGLQHVLEAARRNVNMTLILLNNLIYGMTGGQISGLTTNEFKNDHKIMDNTPPFDVCKLANQAGASFVARVNSPKNFVTRIKEAIQTKGFSLVEISSLCQPYGAKKIDTLSQWSEKDTLLRNDRVELKAIPRTTSPLLKKDDIIHTVFHSALIKRTGMLIAGSAGGGVQSAAKMLAKAGMMCGLSVSMKGEYPITVGSGFSVAEVILSREKINYTGLERPDVAIVISEDGLTKVHDLIGNAGTLILDQKLKTDEFNKSLIADFSGIGGRKGAALCAITWWIKQSGIIPFKALAEVVKKQKYAVALMEIINKTDKLKIN